jgi:hypothetical protein
VFGILPGQPQRQKLVYQPIIFQQGEHAVRPNQAWFAFANQGLLRSKGQDTDFAVAVYLQQQALNRFGLN